jgi:hypothetical protein
MIYPVGDRLPHVAADRRRQVAGTLLKPRQRRVQERQARVASGLQLDLLEVLDERVRVLLRDRLALVSATGGERKPGHRDRKRRERASH